MKKKLKKEFGAAIVICFFILIVMIASWLLTKIGFDGSKTTIVNNSLETSLITVNNIFSVEGFRFIFGNFITNVKLFEPLVLLIIALIGTSIIETSGIMIYISKYFRKVKSIILTFIVVLTSIIFVFFGEYSYLLLMPIIALLYKELGKNPVLGILTVFLGITLGYGAGIIFNYNDYMLSGLTELAATIDVDKNYKFNITSNLYVMIASTIILSLFISYLIEKRLVKKFPKVKQEEIEIIEDSKNEKKAFLTSMVFLIIFIITTIILLLPGGIGSKIFLIDDKSYIIRFFSDVAPAKEGMFLLLLLGGTITSFIYGKIAKTINNTSELSIGFSKHFANVGYLFVLIFFVSQLIAILNWTNISEVVSVNLIEFMSKLEFSGLPLILTLFIITILIGILIPSTLVKWGLMSPLTVPLFMRANITPEFTQFIFKAADGVGKTFTFIFSYFIIMLGFMQKYNGEKEVSIFGTLKLIMPVVLLAALMWIIIIVGFYIIGLPIGPSSYPTL